MSNYDIELYESIMDEDIIKMKTLVNELKKKIN